MVKISEVSVGWARVCLKNLKTAIEKREEPGEEEKEIFRGIEGYMNRDEEITVAEIEKILEKLSDEVIEIKLGEILWQEADRLLEE